VIGEGNRNLMRRVGFFENFDRNTGEVSYIRRLSRQAYYPRYHVYLNEAQTGERIINLHIDQKRPSYSNTTAHSGEYNSPVVQSEGNRIKFILDEMAAKIENAKKKEVETERKVSWWRRLFGKS